VVECWGCHFVIVAGSAITAEGVPAPGPVPIAAASEEPRDGVIGAVLAGGASKRAKHCQQYSAVAAFWAPQLGQARSSTVAPSHWVSKRTEVRLRPAPPLTRRVRSGG
jgi:hypothetical protein